MSLIYTSPPSPGVLVTVIRYVLLVHHILQLVQQQVQIAVVDLVARRLLRIEVLFVVATLRLEGEQLWLLGARWLQLDLVLLSVLLLHDLLLEEVIPRFFLCE